MSLTPEDRQRIYEEEKARIEAQQQIAHETKVETERRQAEGLNKPANQIIVIVLLIGFIFTVIPAYQAIMKSQPISDPVSTSLPDVVNLVSGQDEAQKQKIVVQKGYTFTQDNTLDYLRGSVKNNSTRTVSYWKAAASFYDKKGNIIDSAIDNSLDTLPPGASKRFEIMHSHVPGAVKASVIVEEVVFNP